MNYVTLPDTVSVWVSHPTTTRASRHKTWQIRPVRMNTPTSWGRWPQSGGFVFWSFDTDKQVPGMLTAELWEWNTFCQVKMSMHTNNVWVVLSVIWMKPLPLYRDGSCGRCHALEISTTKMQNCSLSLNLQFIICDHEFFTHFLSYFLFCSSTFKRIFQHLENKLIFCQSLSLIRG